MTGLDVTAADGLRDAPSHEPLQDQRSVML
jgi:hypothetical protein